MTPYERGWLVATLEADAGIYSEHKDRDRICRRVVIDVEVSNSDVAERLADLMGTNSPRRREARREDRIEWTRPTFRVRLRGRRAEALLEDLFDDFTAETRVRIVRAIVDTRASRTPGTPSPLRGRRSVGTA